jgi:bacterial/archaeal transporter family protein
MEKWIQLVLLSGLILGFYNIFKKKALEKNNVIEVLVTYSVLSFLIVIPEFNNAMKIESTFIIMIFIKSFIVFISWLISFKALKNMPISTYSVYYLSRILFVALWGIIILGEKVIPIHILGMIIIIIGLLMVNVNANIKKEKVDNHYILYVVVSCFIISFSSVIDKIVMRSINTGQMQFWFMGFLAMLYVLYIIINKIKLDFLAIKKNYWLPILAISVVAASRFHFLANAIPESNISLIIFLRTFSVVITLLVGGMWLKEQNLLYKLFCSLIILAGIALITIY